MCCKIPPELPSRSFLSAWKNGSTSKRRNPDLPRIHGELLKLGFEVSERSVSRWIRPRDPDSVKRWLTFLRNHREAIAAMDFFTVPTLTFGVLSCFFVIGHDRRKILHFNVTRNPSALWVVQQLRLCRTTAPLQYPEPFRTPVIRHSLAPVEDRNTDQNRDEILQRHASTRRS